MQIRVNVILELSTASIFSKHGKNNQTLIPWSVAETSENKTKLLVPVK